MKFFFNCEVKLSQLCALWENDSRQRTFSTFGRSHIDFFAIYSWSLLWFIFLWGLVNTGQMFQCFSNRKCSAKPLGVEDEGRGDRKVKARGDISGLHILDKYTVWRTVLSAGVDTAWQPFKSNTALKHARAIRRTPLRPAVTFKHTIFHVEARLASARWNHITVVVKPAVISQRGGGLFKHNLATVSFWGQSAGSKHDLNLEGFFFFPSV